MGTRNLNLRAVSCVVIGVVLMGSSGATVTLAGEGDVLAHATAAYEDGLILADEPAAAGADRDIIIIHRYEPWVYFGMFNVSEMTGRGLFLLERTFNWTFDSRRTDHVPTVWLATFNGTLDPQFPEERDGIAVYEFLLEQLSIRRANIHVEDQFSIETGDFSKFDIVFYAWTAPRSAQNVIDQGKPFITFSASQTDELGIGTGVTTMQEGRDSAYVVNAGFGYPTSGWGYDQFFLEGPMGMEATTRAGHGIALVAADDRGDSGACCRDGACSITLEADCRRCVRSPQWWCDLDPDADGQVNPVDAGFVQAAFGSTDETDLCQYDIDCDGQINPVDSGIVQSLFGTCESPRDSCS